MMASRPAGRPAAAGLSFVKESGSPARRPSRGASKKPSARVCPQSLPDKDGPQGGSLKSGDLSDAVAAKTSWRQGSANPPISWASRPRNPDQRPGPRFNHHRQEWRADALSDPISTWFDPRQDPRHSPTPRELSRSSARPSVTTPESWVRRSWRASTSSSTESRAVLFGISLRAVHPQFGRRGGVSRLAGVPIFPVPSITAA